MGEPNALIHAARVRVVTLIPHQDYVGKLLGDHVCAAVRRVPVHADDLEDNALGVAINGIKTVPQKAASIVIRNNYREIENRLRHS